MALDLPMDVPMQSIARWSQGAVGRLIFFLIALVGLWLPAALAWLLVTGWRPGIAFDTLAPMQLLGISVILYAAILGLLWFIAHRIDGRSLDQFGLTGDLANLKLLGLGLAFGWSGLVLLLVLEGALGWLRWDGSGLEKFGQFFAEGLLVGLAVGSIEELLFRGFLIHTIERRYGLVTAWTGSALIFALTHFLKALAVILATWPQFPGLVAMGLVLALARYQGGGRLGLCVGLHAGWVWAYYVVNTLDLVVYDRPGIPEWLTGIGHNPLAGLTGLGFLLATGVLVSRLPRLPEAPDR